MSKKDIGPMRKDNIRQLKDMNNLKTRFFLKKQGEMQRNEF